MTNRKLLVVEDETIVALSLCATLRKLGYTVASPVGTGVAAIDAATADHPDVILMDIRLAGAMDGIEAAARILSAARPIVIFMTGYSDQSTRDRAASVPYAAFLTKPLVPQQIVAAIEKAIG